MLEKFSAHVLRSYLILTARFPFLVPEKRGGIHHLLLAIILMVVALWVRMAIAPIAAGLQYLTFFPAVALAAIVGGYRAGLLAVLIGIVFATFIFTPPYYSISLEVLQASLWSNVVFLMDGIIVSFSIEAMHRYRQKYAFELKQSTEAHNALIDSTKNLKKILDHLFAYVVLLDTNGVIQKINKAALDRTGGSLDDAVGVPFQDTSWWSHDELVRVQLISAIEAAKRGRAQRFDVTVKMDDDLVPLDFQIAAVLDDNGEVAGLLSTAVDITERKSTEAALMKAISRLKEKELSSSRFLAAAGHDLRQPLAAATLYIDTLKLTETTPKQSEILKGLDQSMSTFKGLLDTLLDVSRLDAGIVKPEYRSIDVSDLMIWLEQTFAPVAAKKSLGLRLYVPLKETLFVHSDIGLLKSVLMNLVSNAIKYTSKGAILISARQRSDYALFQVWDTGIGIPPEHLEHIYNEFYQINNPQRDRSVGLGLGLSIAKRALTLLSAELNCRSRSMHGSVFEFRLPLDLAAHALSNPATQAVLPHGSFDLAFARGKLFIVVEDDQLVSQALVSWLEAIEGRVEYFPNAEEALTHANIEHADYFIADYMLSGTLNGIQFLNLASKKRSRPLKGVVVSGDTSSAFIRHAAQCEWPVMHKPVNTSELISKLSAQ
ncbi:MAG: hypothetical protein A2061_03570 [Gallionellales bacterium GWA2_59_43]|nr:MAG: hypothetical protein A2061_03570 [Gallionellales bacterium GWA2_59_43]